VGYFSENILRKFLIEMLSNFTCHRLLHCRFKCGPQFSEICMRYENEKYKTNKTEMAENFILHVNACRKIQLSRITNEGGKHLYNKLCQYLQ
jgi:hypothetical protein